MMDSGSGVGYAQRFSGTLTRQDSRSVRRFRCFVPPGATQVMVRLVYRPRKEDSDAPLSPAEFRTRWAGEIARYRGKVAQAGDPGLVAHFERFVDDACGRVHPLPNLLNLAVFDSIGAFRGRWDSPQHFGEWVSVGESHATRGFVAGTLPPGEWTIVLECHAVVTQDCSFDLDVKCAVSGGSWFRGELHSHTNHSDGALSPCDLVEAAREAGLDFIALTDHNTMSALAEIGVPGVAGALVAERGTGTSAGVDPSERPVVIPGMELTTFYGHAVALGVAEFIPWHGASKAEGLNLQATHVHRLGGLFSIAHPFSMGYPVCAGCEWEYENTDLGLVDLMEVWSGPWAAHIMWNVLAMRWWDFLLCKGYRITGVAARDAHKRDHLFERDTADTYVWARSLSDRDILQGLRTGRVYVSSGPQLEFSLEAGGCEGLYMPGDRVLVSEGARLGFTVRVFLSRGGRQTNRHPEDLIARVVKGTRHGEVGTISATRITRSDDECVEFEDAATRDAWYRCEILAGDRPRLPGPYLVAFTNPIHVEVISRETC